MTIFGSKSFFAIALSAFILSAGCATQTTTVRESTFGSLGGAGGSGMGRTGISVEVREDGLHYKGDKIALERLIKRLLDEEAENNQQAKRTKNRIPQILSRPVHLVEKDRMPNGYMEDLRRHFVNNNIVNAIIVGKKTTASYETENIPEPPKTTSDPPKLISPRRPTPVRPPSNTRR